MSPSSSLVNNKEFINSDTHHPPLDSMEMDLFEVDNKGSHIRDHELSQINVRSHATSESMIEGLDLLKRFRSQLNLPDRVLYKAYRIYRRCVTKDILVGRDRKSISLACLYRACLEEELPRPLHIFERKVEGENKVGHAYNIIKENLELNSIFPDVTNCLDYLDVRAEIKQNIRKEIDSWATNGHPWTSLAVLACMVKDKPTAEFKRNLCKQLGINKQFLNRKLRMKE